MPNLDDEAHDAHGTQPSMKGSTSVGNVLVTSTAATTTVETRDSRSYDERDLRAPATMDGYASLKKAVQEGLPAA